MKTALWYLSFIIVLVLCVAPACAGFATVQAGLINDACEFVALNDAQIPVLVQVGHRFNIGGVIQSQEGIITEIKATVTSADGIEKTKIVLSPNTSTFRLEDSAIAQKMDFQVYKKGAYLFNITVSVDIDDEIKTAVLVDQMVCVIEENPEALKEQRLSIQIENAWSPTFLSKNVMFPLRGIIRSASIITDVTATIYTPTGNIAMISSFSPCSQKYSLVQSEVDSGINFGSLPAGNYVYELTTTVTNGVDFKTKVLIYQPFEVSPTGIDCFGTDAIID
ncbi:MAG: hypothetical protein IKC28_06260 [Clostridia bacterium]|nr:hypothetical protein [Clostridia bacterium]